MTQDVSAQLEKTAFRRENHSGEFILKVDILI